MKERGIIFTGESVRAILAGRKTQTRRIVRIDDTPISANMGRKQRLQHGIPTDAANVRLVGWLKCDAPPESTTVSSRVACPYGEIDDLLWVREAFQLEWFTDEHFYNDIEGHSRSSTFKRCIDEPGSAVWYRTEEKPPHDNAEFWDGKWRSPLFMPRWASRITLRVTSVRVERLQAISEDDARAEGVDRASTGRRVYPGTGAAFVESYRAGFEAAWTAINGKRAPWSANPWVWVVGFEVESASKAAAA